ncbi:MBL fold metallo-hydrolase [Ktedonosporobacter rubrisoli]|uniref:MBL fold metallo-hydrolase n=1 Tax=Ktedonosporobacter rubrisoli TaxID=2509675 RepID=A0A4P6JW11_KTERU|nr:MBL fold metallo-hydrolase [Ktedonosporobacter rubrisoli]QBD79868.1 MBL fold metallo-hydrolase [Ktedonosporobacter rubrisoli]
MEKWICATCGTQFPASEKQPVVCPICSETRQYIGHHGQQWTTTEQLKKEHRHIVQQHEPHLIGVGIEPSFAIGQRALLIQTEKGNVLWDCVNFLNQETVEVIQQLGGLQAIAISHPHYYTSMVDWAEQFDAPIYLHEADRQWVMRPSERIVFWSGETHELLDGLTLINLGGHFAGGTVLHWRDGANGKGALLSGDIIYVVADHNWVSFMYSYPNLIPLPSSEVRKMRDMIAPYQFERIYAAWFERLTPQGGHEAVMRSADRYIAILEQGITAIEPTREERR